MSLPLRWLYIDFNCYFASVEQQLNPAWRGRPLAVVPVLSDSSSVIAASREAKRFGIKTGTPIWEARAKCPDIICVLGRHEEYVAYHHRAIAEVENHLPVTMVCSIDEIACRLMSNENSVEQATALAKNIKRGLARAIGECITCSIGVAPNRYLAKVATDMQKPDGLTFLRAEDFPTKLLPLPLRDLPGIGVNMERRLNRRGIWRMEDLIALDIRQMRAVWGGIWGERMWYYLRGVELPDVETTRSSVGHSHVLAPALRPPDQARYVARRLMLKATSRLRRLGYLARACSLSIRIEEGERYFIEARCEPASDSLSFLHLLEEMWRVTLAQAQREWANPCRALRIKKVSVTLYHLDAVDSLGQGDLFRFTSPREMRLRQRADRLSRALDRLNQRFGRDTVSVGMVPSQSRGFSGTKIAFTRIPDAEEFLE